MAKTYRHKRPHKKNKTQKHNRSNSSTSLIVHNLLEMLNTVKLYHWNTLSYSQHKATDQLYSDLNESIDSFVEILLGKTEGRIGKMANVCRHYDFKLHGDEEPSATLFKQKIFEYRRFLQELNRLFSEKKDSDLLNVRDEIVGQLNQFLYLLTFTK
jgi:DNA-binding ferritin-like protein